MVHSTADGAAGHLAAKLSDARAAEARGDVVAAQFAYVEVLQADADHPLARARLAALDAAMNPTYQALSPPYAPLSALFGQYQTGHLGQALGSAQGMLGQYPRSHFLHNLAGVILHQTGKPELAVAPFQAALAIKPDYADAHYNLALALRDLGRSDDALGFFVRAVALVPNNPEWLMQMAVFCALHTYHKDAVRLFERVLAIQPHDRSALLGLAASAQVVGDFARAIAALRECLEHHPDCENALVQLSHACAHVCDWSFMLTPDDLTRVGLGREIVSPFVALMLEDHPERTLRRMRATGEATAAKFRTGVPALPAAGARMRIGYFSADFRDHATMYLMAGVFREHDRAAFEIHAYSYSAWQGDAWRDRMQGWCDGFHQVQDLSDAAVVALARSHDLDLAVDLKGYTQEARVDLFAQRLAPVQAQYLGFPGTMGAPYIDYLVADSVVIPPAHRLHYSESVVYLPGSYQANDNQRPIDPDTGTRAAHGLPDQGVVLCCFNAPWKIRPVEFAIWMRLLAAVPGSVLWLFEANALVAANLRRAAQDSGVDPSRLVFAPQVSHARHLARLTHADLFLDTFICNAHTTCSDALWAGVPVLTMAGMAFAARVSASLLHAVGLPELVTASPAAYEAVAGELARDRARLAALRAQLAQNRLTMPLFDTTRFTRNLEAAWRAIILRSRAGEIPADIHV